MTWYWITLLVVGHVVFGLTVVIVGNYLTRQNTTASELTFAVILGYLFVIGIPVYLYMWMDILTKEGFLDFRRKVTQDNQVVTPNKKGKSESVKTELQL